MTNLVVMCPVREIISDEVAKMILAKAATLGLAVECVGQGYAFLGTNEQAEALIVDLPGWAIGRRINWTTWSPEQAVAEAGP